MTGYDGELLIEFTVGGQHRQYYSPDPEGTGTGTMSAEENTDWVPPSATGNITIHSDDDVPTGEVRVIDAGGEVHKRYPSYQGAYYSQYVTLPSSPGHYRLDVGSATIARFEVRDRAGAVDNSGQPDHFSEQRGPDNETDPANRPGMVNDGDGGAIIAPFDGSDPGNWGVDAPTDAAEEAAEETYGSGGGMIGAGVAAVVLVLAGAAALLGGN